MSTPDTDSLSILRCPLCGKLATDIDDSMAFCACGHEWYEGTSGGGASPLGALWAAADVLGVRGDWVGEQMEHVGDSWPPKNAWTGVSVTNQPDADERLDDLCATPAAHRWISYEPARGEVDFGPWLYEDRYRCSGCEWDNPEGPADCPGHWREPLDLIIMGGLHASGAQMPLDWAHKTRDDCAAAGCAFALKQLAGGRPEHWPLLDGRRHTDVPWMGAARDQRPTTAKGVSR